MSLSFNHCRGVLLFIALQLHGLSVDVQFPELAASTDQDGDVLQSALGFNGSFSAPHRSAALAGQQVLHAGGSAIEAMVAAAATIAVVYPHMNGIGGDGFWLIKQKGKAPVAIRACGQAAGLATPEFYKDRGHANSIPARGALAALTIPGSVGGWQRALELCPRERRWPVSELLENAIAYARDGIAVTSNQEECTASKLSSLETVPGFAEVYLQAGAPYVAGSRLVQNALANTLEQLGREGLDSYYRGELAATHARYLEEQGSPLRIKDFNDYNAALVEPLTLETSQGALFNMTPPTQGVSSLMILGLFDRLKVNAGESFAHIHGLIEATKQAFLVRNAGLGDAEYMTESAAQWLESRFLDKLARNIKSDAALPWPYEPANGDTIWMGAADREGTVVSFIQSVFWEFGSGLLCPDTGVVFQNRGAGFSLAEGANQLQPGKLPFHTLNPAMAILKDKRVMAYGTMGGEGQPQTQSAVFSRYVQFGTDLQQAVTQPRWLLGKTWGDNTTTLKLEARFPESLIMELEKAGHIVEMLPAYSDLAGHAGAVVLHSNGLMESATDPRADGAALSF